MMKIEFDKSSFIINGERKFFVSGEFPYFRVPKADWDRRLDLFIEAGGNCVATYVPWVVHEPNEGEILFDDCDYRSLTDFMETVKRKGLALVVRPGPYVYSELINSGLPTWLVRNYPELHAKTIDGESFREESCSYLHPLFLEFTKKWYAEFARVIKPYLSQNGGPIVMVQLDNEVIGVHEWWGSIDYNPTTMGFGKADGRYPLFLKKKYGNIQTLNEAYGTNYSDFTDVHPKTDGTKGKENARKIKDYHDFYCGTVEEYVVVLRDILIKNGINTSFCHNASGAYVIAMTKDMNSKMGEGFLLGVDNYYTLGINWPQNNPTPLYFTRVLFAADQLKLLGNPPTVLEMPGGSPSDIPPILKEDLYTCYMTNLAAGMRGVNYYIFAGGKNVEGTGFMADVYDFNTFISPEGEVRPIYAALKAFNQVMHDNEWLCDTERFASVQVGTEWQTLRGNSYAETAEAYHTASAQQNMDKCVTYSLLSGKYSGAYTLLDGELDVSKPLIICGTDTMSKQAQENVVQFLEKGGKLLLLTAFPEMDECFTPCTILKDYIGEMQTEKNDTTSYVTLAEGMRVYRISCEKKLTKLPDGATVFAMDGDEKNVLGFRKQTGRGEIIYLGGNWLTADFMQVELLEKILASFEAKPCVENSNRTIFSTLFEKEGIRGVFLLNLFTGEQTTHVKVYGNGNCVDLGDVHLAPMEVRFIRLEN